MKPKELLILSIVLITLMFVICDSCSALTEREVTLTKNRTLIVKEVVVANVDSFPHVPAGLSKEVADSLVIGSLKKFIIKDETGRKTSSFSLPFIKSETTYRDKEVTYSNKWIIQDSTESALRYDDYLLSALWLWTVVALIAVVSITNVVSRVGTKKLLVFYTTILLGICIGVLGSILTGMCIDASASESPGFIVGAFVGAVMGALAGGYASNLSPEGKRGGLGMLAGLAAGGISGYFAGIFAIMQNYEIVLDYGLFLFGVETLFSIILLILFTYAEQQRARAGLKAEIESETPDF